ncbi:MAG: hypothetical protein AABZ47_13315 [Planctomycetota bacterium]
MSLRALGLEPKTYGLKGRCSDAVSDEKTTTYENPVSALPSGMPSEVEKDSQNDPELQAVISAWPGLPEAIRARIVGLVEGATTKGL